jgi:ABC-type glycerol-3-phosphate transport system permease component
MAGFPDHGVVAGVQRPAAVRRTAVRPQARARQIGVYALLIVLAVITIFPLLWMVLTSLTPQNEVFGAVLPTTIDPSGYGRIWTSGNLPRAFTNSVIVTGMTVVIVVGVATLTGYAFARLTFPARDWIFYVFLAAMMIPGQAILVPMFIFLKQIGLLDTLPGLSFSYLGGALPFATFLMRAFFKTLPTELGDAGKIDGCSDFGVFRRVYLPLTSPGIATITIFQFVGTWNEFLFSNTFIATPELKTLQPALYAAVGQYSTDWPALTAGLTLAVVPIVIVYLVLQRQFISGLTAGALKG